MKILIVNDYAYPAGGIEVFLDEVVLATKEWVDYRMLTWPPAENLPKRSEIIPTHRINCGSFTQILSAIKWADLIFLPLSWNIRVLASIVRDYCRSSRTPLVTVVHTSCNSSKECSFDDFQRKLMREVLELSEVVIGVSDDVLESLQDLKLADTNNSYKYRKIENASRFAPRSTKSQQRKTVSFVGRPTYVKGIDLFLQVAEQLHDTHLKFKLNTVSLPPPEEAKNLPNVVECQWLVSDKQMIEFYDSTDLLITPYRKADGLPMTIVEALSRQVPVIGFNTPGVGDVLSRHHQLVLAPEDVFGLAETVRNWYQGRLALDVPNPSLIPTWEEQGMKYVHIFREVLNV